MSETTGKELARVGSYGRSSLTEKQQYAHALAQAGDLVPKTFWTKPTNVNGTMVPPQPNPGAILFMLETAAMVGVNPMVGLTNIHIIEGKPSLSANLQAALVREAGHRLRVWTDGEGENVKAICEIVRSDDPEFTFRVMWGKAEATAAGVLGKDNWKKYRRSMLKARAITECIREACPEVLMGATYSPDELGANTDEMGEPIDLEQVPSAPTVSRETRPEAPIVDTPAEPATDAFDWGQALANASSRDDVDALYQKARREGVLAMPFKVGKIQSELGAEIIKVGKALAEAEAAGVPLTDEEPAVLDDTVVAEVVEEPEPEPKRTRAPRAPKSEPVDAEVVEDAPAS